MGAALFPDLVVNGETVPHTVVAAEAQNHTAPEDKPGIAWRKAARAIALRTLLLQEACRRGLKPKQAKIGPGRFETEEEALIRGLLEEAVEIDPPSMDDVRTEWDRNRTRFKTPPLWDVSHILCACDPRDKPARDAAEIRAVGLTQQLDSNHGRFARLATQNSDCNSKSSGGALGQLGPGETVPEFEAALRRLSEGAITTEPVLTRHGYHIVRLNAVAEGKALPFEAVKEKIAEAMEKAAWVRSAKVFVDELALASEVSGAEIGPV